MQYRRAYADAVECYARVDNWLPQGNAGNGLRASARLNAGMAWLRQWRLAEAAELFRQASKLDPDNRMAAGWSELIELVQQSLPLRRELLEPVDVASCLRRPPAPAARLEVVYFYCGRSEPHFTQACSMLERSIAAARKAVPAARLTLLTDDGPPFPAHLGFDRVVQYELPSRDIALARFIALERYLPEAAHDVAGFVVTEPDCIIHRDPGALFDLDFDLGFTMRDDFVDENLDHEPFNVGVMYVRGRGAAQAARFFGLCREALATVERWPVIERLYGARFRAWSSGQIVPAALVDWQWYLTRVFAGRSNRMRVEDTTLAFLPSDGLNFPFDPKLGAAVLAQKFVVHYKGGWRKQALLDEPPG
jgi:tetratricopeptide (TPR) repeat protein